MSLPQVFNFDDQQIRTIENDGELWFVGKDVADALGYGASRNAVRDFCKGGIKTMLPTNGGNQEMIIIPERDVYRLIMRSKLPSAEKFEEWVVSEVLPTIRKTGNYVAPESPALQIAHAMLLAGKMIEEQKLQIEEMQPKADFFDAVTDSTDAVDIGTVAKVLNCGIGRTKLFEFLRNEKILQSKNTPYQKYIDCGYFRVIESSYQKPDGSSHVSFKTVVYQSGVNFIRKKLASSAS